MWQTEITFKEITGQLYPNYTGISSCSWGTAKKMPILVDIFCDRTYCSSVMPHDAVCIWSKPISAILTWRELGLSLNTDTVIKVLQQPPQAVRQIGRRQWRLESSSTIKIGITGYLGSSWVNKRAKFLSTNRKAHYKDTWPDDHHRGVQHFREG